MLHNVVHALLGSQCGHCHAPLYSDASLCESCVETIVYLPSEKIGTLNVHALSSYDYPLRSLMHRSVRTTQSLGSLLYEQQGSRLHNVDYLIPVPRYPKDIHRRGYQSSLVLAKQLSKLSGTPVLECIIRVKPAIRRGLYSKIEQHRYRQDAFRVTPDITDVEGNVLMLIDDICRTGSTLGLVAKKLNLGRPKSMEALVVCRQLH